MARSRRAAAIAAPPRLRLRPGISLRILSGLVAMVLLSLLAVAAIAGYFTYRVIAEHNDSENVTPTSFLLTNFESLSFTDRLGGEHEGWLLHGLRGAPAIVLCPAYDSNRSDLLPLGAILQANGFNVYTFNFGGAKTRQSISDLGNQQVDDLLSAIQTVTKQRDVNPHTIGLYGATTGAYAVLVAAEQLPLVKAIVIDSVYERPVQMFDSELDQLLGGTSGPFRTIADLEFRLVKGKNTLPVREDLAKLGTIPKFFISAQDRPVLANITNELYAFSPQPKRMWILEHSYTGQSTGPEKKEYENQVLTFFTQYMHPRAD